MADDYKIRITTEGDPKGAEKIADSLKKVGKAAEDQSQATNKSAKGLNELGEATEKGAAVGRVLGQVMTGNIAALAQLGTALKATGAAMRTNLIGIGLIGATAVLNFFQNLKRDTDDAADAAKSSIAAFDEQRAAVERLSKVRLDSLLTQLESITAASKAALDFASQLDASQSKIDSAKMGLELAQLGADATLTPNQKKEREFSIRQRYADSGSSREASAIQYRVKLAEDDVARKAEIADRVERERDSQRALVEATEGRRTALNSAMKGLNSQLGVALSGAGSDEAAKRAIGAEYATRSAALSDRQAAAFGPAADARLAQMKTILDGLESQAKAAGAARAGAETDLLTARQIADRDQSTRPTVRSLERRAARVGAGLPDPVSNIAPPAMMTPESSFSRAAPEKNYDAIARAMLDAGEQSGAAMAAAMIEAVKKSQAAQVEAFREQLKALQR